MYQGRTKKRLLAGAGSVGLLAAVLLGGCGSSAPGSLPEVPETTIPDEMEQELLGDTLEKQLLAILNLGRQEDEKVVSDDELEIVADSYLEEALVDPQTCPADGQYKNVNGEKNFYFMVYDGTLSLTDADKASVDAHRAILASLKELDQTAALYYGKLHSLEVAYGQNDERAVWVVLVEYEPQM